MEYTTYVFGCPDEDKPVYIPGDEIKVNASSLDEALPLIEQKARIQFPLDRFPLVHIDHIYDEKGLVCRTEWDEIGPLASVRDVDF